MGKSNQQRVEYDHQHLKGRVRGMRGFKTLAGATVVCRADAFLRNLHGDFYTRGLAIEEAATLPGSPVLRAWGPLTADLLARRSRPIIPASGLVLASSSIGPDCLAAPGHECQNLRTNGRTGQDGGTLLLHGRLSSPHPD